MSSRRKISRLEYSEWIISCKSCLTSAWKPSVSRAAVVVVMVLHSDRKGSAQGDPDGAQF